MVATALVGAIATARPAQAQSPIPIRLKLGVLAATDPDVRDVTHSPMFSGEVEVRLPVSQLSVSLGYAYGEKGGTNFRSIPLLVNKIFSPPNPLAGTVGNLYYGAGLGLYFLHRGGHDSGSNTNFGGRGTIGYQFPNPFFVEAQYHMVAGGVKGLSPNGLALYGGYKF